MRVTVELFRDAAQFAQREQFSCSYLEWDFLRELGETFGWHPTGTTYVAPPRRKVESPVARNYHPGDVLDRKRVETDDALAWARALETARRSPHFAAIAKASSGPNTADADSLVTRLAEATDEFVRFAQGGAFTFALSADADAGAAGASEAARKVTTGAVAK